MKKYLLPAGGQFYKANLHCHSTISDGALTPKELKQMYMEHGYSIIAYTDHNIFIPHADLCDEKFLALNGYEININEEAGKEKSCSKTCHICLVALSPDNRNHICYHRTKYISKRAREAFADQIQFDESLPDFERVYTPECINEIIKTARECGFFVTYNHPTWSLETAAEYCNFHGMHAMEICNYGCIAVGYPDYNEKEYDQMLRGGERIYCIATDDNHNAYPVNSRDCDSFGGFTMIKAERLDYRTITDALLAGHFYASEGPAITDLWLEDGKIHITCPGADSIYMSTARRRAAVKFAEGGVLLTAASFEVKPEDVYVRLTVVDEHGKHANTNAYFTDQLFLE